jgi:branched-chain amino acid transport system ATP-binding protein
MHPMLEIRDVSMRFGGLDALRNVSFEVYPGETVGLIGPNGAGKTTLFSVSAGVFSPTSGQIILNREDITGLKPHQIARRGVARVFQGNVLFSKFTVLQNVLLGLHLRTRLVLRRISFHPSSISESEIDLAVGILKEVGLLPFKDYLASDLPHGHQRLLGLGIALASDPKILLLDEPVTGMNVEEKKFMIDIISVLQSKKITFLIVEHDIKTVMNICPRIVVLNFGNKIAEGSPGEIRRNKDVIEAYLGAEAS